MGPEHLRVAPASGIETFWDPHNKRTHLTTKLRNHTFICQSVLRTQVSLPKLCRPIWGSYTLIMLSLTSVCMQTWVDILIPWVNINESNSLGDSSYNKKHRQNNPLSDFRRYITSQALLLRFLPVSFLCLVWVQNKSRWWYNAVLITADDYWCY